MQTDFSFLHLVLGASPLVQLVMGALLLASLASWAMIFDRLKVLRRARDEADEFERRFWAGGDLSKLYRGIDKATAVGMSAIFHAGFREYAKLRENKGLEVADIVESVRRAMRVAASREVDKLETSLSFLATVGSTSPYVGLFGTVWGIMNAFVALGNVKQATLNLVAPGIAEALIATAMGLFAAIPAVVAYNKFSHNVARLDGRYDDFLEEFSNILQRQAHAAATQTV
jgi:biopolymer transport protein TolQ